MLLARAGADVTVFERHAKVGGRSATITAPSPAGTFRFDMGPTFFLYPRVLADIFAACGRDMEREIDLIRLDPMYHLVFESGGSILASGDMDKLAAAVAQIAPKDALALPRFMADNRAKLAAFRPILESPFHGPLNMLRPDVLRSLKMMRPHRTVDSDLAHYFDDERVRLAFSFQSKYLGMSPFRCPSLFTILSFMEYEFGVFHPRGGCGALMETLGDVARDMGAEFRLGGAGAGDPVRGPPRHRHPHRRRRRAFRRPGDQRRLRPDHDPAGPRPPAPPLDRPQAGDQEVLVQHLHALPRH